MDYIEEGKKPPKCKNIISTPQELVKKLRSLIGQKIQMTGKSRTDGSNFRKIITNYLLAEYMPEAASEYEIVPPKQKGQQLERMVAYQLGYRKVQDGLEGGYPDIRNQMLEIKVQDSPTIDLGRYSPQFEEQINNNFTTRTIRYLIALTNCVNGAIDALIICPGEELGKYFTYVAEKSFKCQKSIPMSFFEQYKGDVVFNP